MQGWVDLVGLVAYRDGIPIQRRSLIPVQTGLDIEYLHSCDKRRYHYAKSAKHAPVNGHSPAKSRSWSSFSMCHLTDSDQRQCLIGHRLSPIPHKTGHFGDVLASQPLGCYWRIITGQCWGPLSLKEGQQLCAPTTYHRHGNTPSWGMVHHWKVVKNRTHGDKRCTWFLQARCTSYASKCIKALMVLSSSYSGDSTHRLQLMHKMIIHSLDESQLFYGPLRFCPGPPGWASTRKVKPVWIYWSKW